MLPISVLPVLYSKRFPVQIIMWFLSPDWIQTDTISYKKNQIKPKVRKQKTLLNIKEVNKLEKRKSGESIKKFEKHLESNATFKWQC